ncbi:MAG: penicillin-binding protein 2 [Acidimicrobiia bacterium]|nr:penicillin-binding protein 2 [Acidimicrobiia bacterium]
MTEAKSRVRLGIIGVIVMALFSALFVRLWFLQVGSSSTGFAAQTEANRVRILHEPAVRGSIYDRRGQKLVENELVNTIRIRRGLTDEERKILVPNLAKALKSEGVTKGYVNDRLDSGRYGPYEPVPIKDDVPYKKLVYIKERPEMFPKVDVVRRSVRVYKLFEEIKLIYPSVFAEATPASHVLGYVGPVNKGEQKLHKGEGYGPDDVIGKVGVEQVFESELRGEPRTRKLEVDSRGRLVQVLRDKAAQAGNDVQLTLDLDVQRVAEESLTVAMRKAGKLKDPSIKDRFKTFSAKGGAAVVMDATDGSIVALASAPTFDITEFTDGIPIEKYVALNDPKSNFPLLDRAIQGQYAPGSTFKTFTALAALESGTTTPDEIIQDNGELKFGDPPNEQTFKNAGKERHGAVRMESAIQVSSDVYFYTMGFRFWHAYNNSNLKKGYVIQHVARRFGFGRSTGTGLPDEHVGRVPDRKFKADLNKNSPNDSDRSWLPGDSAALAVGQGDFLVTPLQLATGYSAFVNGGTIYAPRLASAVLTPGGQSELRKLPPQKIGQVELDPAYRTVIMEGLKKVIIGIGTAAEAFRAYGGLPAAGKTGTAEVFGKQDTSVFVGIINPDATPETITDDPMTHQYVIVVFVEEGGNGGSVAAPVAKRIMQALSGDPNPPEVRLIQPKTPGGDR